MVPNEQFTHLFRLDGKTVLITGAGGAIGRALALGMSAYGAKVSCVDLDAAKAEQTVCAVRQAGGHASAIVLDVSTPEAGEQAVQSTVRQWGRLDVVVNLAGSGILKPSLEFGVNDWERMHDTYLRGTFLFCQAAGKIMIPQGSGSIINVSSVASLVALGRGTASYAAMKAGVNGLTRELALEWAASGVRVNAVAPCQVDTPQLRAVLQNPQFDPERLMAKWISSIPLGRLGRTEELIGPCVFLASDAASLVTGHVLVVDGGYTIQ